MPGGQLKCLLVINKNIAFVNTAFGGMAEISFGRKKTIKL